MTSILSYVSTIGTGTWLDEKGSDVIPEYSDQIDVNTCDRGWEENLKALGFRAEVLPTGNGVARIVPLKAVGSSYIHVKGFKNRHLKKKGY